MITVPNCTIYRNIYERNKDYPEDIALSYYGNKISYRQLFSEVEECAKTLRLIGIKKGACVNLCTAGIPEAIYVVLACSRVGAIANFINPLFSAEQLIDRINDTEAEWLLVLDALYGRIRDSLSKTCIKNVVIIPATNSISKPLSSLLYFKSEARKILNETRTDGQEYFSWTAFKALGEKYTGEIDIPYERDTATVMVYSSGSTGASKGILLTNDGILSTNYNRNIPPDPVKRGDCFLTMIPIWFSTGIVISILIPLINGVTAILEPQFGGETFSKDLKKYKPNMTLTATSLWLYVANNPKMTGADFSRMNCPITGGEKINEADENLINRFLHDHSCNGAIQKGYGMCELGGTVTSTCDRPGFLTKPNGVGYPIHNVIVAAFDEESNEELPYGRHGEIRVFSPSRMKGYYKNPEATDNYFWTDTSGRVWGCTGDIGYVDEDGEVFILGRATDHYKRENGEIIYLFDIENVVLKDASVNQCKVIDAEVNGEVSLICHIVPKYINEDNQAVLKRIDDRLRAELPDHMIPKYYKIRQSMPVHNNGKRDVAAIKMDVEGLIPIKLE